MLPAPGSVSPGETPKFPLIVVGPVLVAVAAARTANDCAEQSIDIADTGEKARAVQTVHIQSARFLKTFFVTFYIYFLKHFFSSDCKNARLAQPDGHAAMASDVFRQKLNDCHSRQREDMVCMNAHRCL